MTAISPLPWFGAGLERLGRSHFHRGFSGVPRLAGWAALFVLLTVCRWWRSAHCVRFQRVCCHRGRAGPLRLVSVCSLSPSAPIHLRIAFSVFVENSFRGFASRSGREILPWATTAGNCPPWRSFPMFVENDVAVCILPLSRMVAFRSFCSPLPDAGYFPKRRVWNSPVPEHPTPGFVRLFWV